MATALLHNTICGILQLSVGSSSRAAGLCECGAAAGVQLHEIAFADHDVVAVACLPVTGERRLSVILQLLVLHVSDHPLQPKVHQAVARHQLTLVTPRDLNTDWLSAERVQFRSDRVECFGIHLYWSLNLLCKPSDGRSLGAKVR